MVVLGWAALGSLVSMTYRLCSPGWFLLVPVSVVRRGLHRCPPVAVLLLDVHRVRPVA